MGNLTNSAKLIEEMNKKAYTTDLGAAALSNQYYDLDGKPTIPTVNNSTIKIQKNSADVDSFTTNASNDKTINIQLTKSDVGLGNVDNTSDANKPVSNATQTALNTKANASDVYTKAEVDAKVSSVYKYKGSKTDYDSLPSSGNVVGDVWNVEAAHTTAPIFPAGSNLAWDGSAWDVLGGTVDLSNYVDKSTNQTIGGTKTFSTSPVVPSKTSDATNTGTAIATEAQVYKKANTSDVLTKTNTTAFTPTGDYNPSTKKYVDDAVAGISGGHDYSWETATISSGAVTLGLRTIVEPTSNFTLNAPSNIEDGMEYVLRCVNGSTAYTLTLGTGFVNDFSTDLTLHANHSDQFTFVAVDGSLELQPEYALYSDLANKANASDVLTKTNTTSFTPTGDYQPATKKYVDDNAGITNDTTGTTTAVQKIWAGTESEFTNLSSKTEGTIYNVFGTGGGSCLGEPTLLATITSDSTATTINTTSQRLYVVTFQTSGSNYNAITSLVYVPLLNTTQRAYGDYNYSAKIYKNSSGNILVVNKYASETTYVYEL